LKIVQKKEIFSELKLLEFKICLNLEIVWTWNLFELKKYSNWKCSNDKNIQIKKCS
jgi:hypothetical protein